MMKKRTKWLLSTLAITGLSLMMGANTVMAQGMSDASAVMEGIILEDSSELPESLSADQKVTYDGVIYEYTSYNDTYTAIGLADGRSEVIIHGQIYGKTVKVIRRLNDMGPTDKVKKITVEEGITNISNEAFAECVNLEELNLPSTLEILATQALWHDYNLKNVNCKSGGAFYSKDGILYKKDGEDVVLECYPSREQMVIQPEVTMLNLHAFQTNRDTKSIVVNNPNFVVEDGVLYRSNQGNSWVALYCLRDKKGEVTLRENTLALMACAFDNCENVTKISFPKELMYCFDNFEHCPALAEFSVDAANTYLSSVNGDLYNKARTTLMFCARTKENIVVPRTVNQLYADAFSGCAVKTIEIPETVTDIMTNAIRNCSMLEKLVMRCRRCGLTSESIQVGSNTTIYCYPDSSPELYAKDKNIKYTYLQGSYMDLVSVKFKDVVASAWYVDAVQFAYDNGIMSGQGNDKFSPDGNINRAEFAQVLYNILNKPAITVTNKFADVKAGDWFANAVSWANANDVASGYPNGNFGVYDNITREQMAVMLYKFAKLKNLDLMTNVGNTDSFPDAGSISEWAKEAMDWATTQKVINGKKAKDGGAILDPKGKATRAECAAMMKNLLEKQSTK